MRASFTIGDRLIGRGAPCYLIAEAGSNHNRSLEQAKRLIDVAAETGWDAVKFQVFRAERIYPKSAGLSAYLKLPKPIYEIIAEMEMPYEWLPILADYCAAKGVHFLASVFDEESAARLDPFVAAHKIASYEMTHLPLVKLVASYGKPVLISTGAATLDEVAETVAAFRATGATQLALLQCTAAYPAPPESLNVRAVATLRDTFGVPTGLSDHSRDAVIGPVTAVACGAAIIEKHFTLSNRLPGPDHAFAIEPHEMAQLAAAVRAAERALGDGLKTPHPVEQELRGFARRSVFAVRAIAPGEPLTPDNIAVLRCGNLPAGLPPKALPDLLGKRAARGIAPDQAITLADVA